MTEEKRRFTRVPLVCRVVLEDKKGDRSEGRVIDISVKGMQLQIENHEHLSSPVKFQATLGEEEPSFTIEGEAEIARETDDGHLGLFLLKIDEDGLAHLRRLVEIQIGDSEQAAEEMSHW